MCLSVCSSETHGQTRENTKIPVFSLFSDSQWSLWLLAHHSWAKWWHNLWHICHVSISQSVQWNTLLLSWGKREREVILSADQLLEAESLQIGASIVASRGPARVLRPVHNFSIQFISKMNWIEFQLLVSLVIKFWLCKLYMQNEQPPQKISINCHNQSMSCKEGILPVTEPKVYCMKGVVLYVTEITYCNILYLNQHSAYSDTYIVIHYTVCNTRYRNNINLLCCSGGTYFLEWIFVRGRVLSTCGGQLGVLLLERCHKIVTLCHTARSYTE